MDRPSLTIGLPPLSLPTPSRGPVSQTPDSTSPYLAIGWTDPGGATTTLRVKSGRYLSDRYQRRMDAKAQNLSAAVPDVDDALQRKVDLLAVVAMIPPLHHMNPTRDDRRRVARSATKVQNTDPYDVMGHLGVSLPRQG